MALETGVTYIEDLVSTNPIGGVDTLDESDNHHRIIKTAVKGSFPNLGAAAITKTAAEINDLVQATSGTLTSPVINGSVTGTAIGRGALVYKSVSETLTTNTYSHLSFNTEDYDTDTIHDVSTNNQRLTVPSGVTKIKLYAQVLFGADTVGERIVIVSKNDETATPTGAIGTPSIQMAPSLSLGTVASLSSPIITVIAGDYFTLAAYQTSGGDLSVANVSGGRRTYFSMEIIK